MKLTQVQFNEVRNWIYRNARPVDLARWQYHFEEGGKETVINALEAYQNEDGGFGHALEADSWNPDSAPIQTWSACEILHEIDCDENHPIVKSILKYLIQSKYFTGSFWYSEIPSNDDYPHAPWWTYTDEERAIWGYNPTAALAGFILCYSKKDSREYNEGLKIAQAAIDAFIKSPEAENMHSLPCYIRLAECIEKSGAKLLNNFQEFKVKLQDRVESIIEKDRKRWEKEYVPMPSRFIESPYSEYYNRNSELMNYELDHIIASRNEEGIWDIPWKWGMYEKEFSISENWWKGINAVDKMLILKAFNRIEGEKGEK
ncbi:hypothetical protein [Clostridium polynesiense]|uniref:hypothetical protein n=1 Tax=Clostridium polynesiense TaxID=1325933 RepID=UPI0005904F9F|nr:hypothetical protein [Clostridium polynesiense]